MSQNQKSSRVDGILAGIASGNEELQKGLPPVDVTVDDNEPKSPLLRNDVDLELSKPKNDKPLPPVVPAQIPKSEPLPEAAKSDDSTNDYGIAEEKSEKMYTESDVQKMIRDRLARVKQTATPADVKEAAKEFKADPNSSDDWQTQLADFVDERLETREKKVQERQWKEEENRKQADFEDKMNNATSRYQDFWPVVNSVEITTSMMIAARELDKPGEFLYAAAKLQPTELAKIAQMPQHKQLIEIGRLEERMRKSNRQTAAPRPLDQVRGDAYTREERAKDT
jgi:hypothetical protein